MDVCQIGGLRLKKHWMKIKSEASDLKNIGLKSNRRPPIEKTSGENEIGGLRLEINWILPKTTRRLKNHLWKMKKHIDFLVEKG